MNTNNLKLLRKQNKKTQADIANILNITTAGYNKYEINNTEPNIETLCKLADYYNVSLDYLVGREFGNELGYVTELQMNFIKLFLKLNERKQLLAMGEIARIAAEE